MQTSVRWQMAKANSQIQRRTFFLTVGVASIVALAANLTWLVVVSRTEPLQTAWLVALANCAIFTLLIAIMGAYAWKLLQGLQAMHKLATTDCLTGVGNRAALSEKLQTTEAQTALQDGCMAVMSLDLDDFKRLNDTHGHRIGDIALKVAADRIAASVNGPENVFRMGGDEFLCLVLNPGTAQAAERVVRRLKFAFAQPMDLGTHQQVVSPSIGVAIANQGEAWEAVLGRSDAAMYRAKRRDQVLNFSPTEQSPALELRSYRTG